MTALLLGIMAAGLATWQLRKLRDTTLMAAAYWGVASIVSISAVEAVVALSSDDIRAGWITPLRFATALTSFCPAMAVMGAKRPQHHAWQFVVLSLWIILALPVVEVLALPAVSRLEIRDARSWFLLLLLVLPIGNYLLTRYAVPAILLGIAQCGLLGGYLPMVPVLPVAPVFFVESAVTVSMGLTLLALILVELGIARHRRSIFVMDRLWLEFRDRFGAVWALRVAQRFNATAEDRQWPARLTWFGSVNTAGEPMALSAEETKLMRSLMVRFVSPSRFDESSNTTPVVAPKSG